MGINYQFLPNAVMGLRLDMAEPCFGATIAFRRHVLAGIGGFEALNNQLADDYDLGKAIRALGYSGEVAATPVVHRCAERSFTELWRHETRWARTIRMIDGPGFIGQGFTYATAWALLGCLCWGFAPVAAAVLLAVVASRLYVVHCVDVATGARARNLWLLPLRDLFSFAVFVTAVFGKTVTWRGGATPSTGPARSRPPRSSPMLRTLFLQAPSFDGFDGGAGSRYQAKREIKSFWYPTWLAQPAALVDQSKLIDAPPHKTSLAEVLPYARSHDMAVLHTSVPSFKSDVKVAEALKAENPDLRIGMIGAKVAVDADGSLRDGAVIDFVARNEFDFTIKEVADGNDWSDIQGLSYRNDSGVVVHNADRPILHDMDALPWVTPIYQRDLKIENYFIGYLKHPTFRSTPGAAARAAAPSACGPRPSAATSIAPAAWRT